MTAKEFNKIKRGDTVRFLGSERLPSHAGANAEVTAINHSANIATLKFDDGKAALVTREQIEFRE